MIVLAIETSCDETAAAIVEKKGDKIKVLSSEIATSMGVHAESGGIIPENAAREQVRSIIPVLEKTISSFLRRQESISIDPGSKSGMTEHEAMTRWAKNNIDAIAVTYGPGLIGSLLVGVETAKTLAVVWDKPIIPVNHLVGHLYSCFIDNTPEFPAVGLVVSGGHTDFVYMTRSANSGQANIKYIGGTRDDAAGEAFDKTARIIGLGYPGGPAISKAAMSSRIKSGMTKLDLFPRPMINSKNLDMSFSGLKTAVLNYVSSHPELVSGSIPGQARDDNISELAAQIQQAIVDTLVEKSILAIKMHKPKSFLLSGGVAANTRLTECMQPRLLMSAEVVKMYVSDIVSSTDNAVMIAVAACFNQKTIDWKNLTAKPGLSIDSR